MTTAPTIDAAQRLFVWLTALFCVSLVVADTTGGKFFTFDVFAIGSYRFVTHSAGMLSFPVTFLLTDLVNEYYGKRAARLVTLVGLGAALLAFLLIFTARQLPVAAMSPVPQEAFDTVFAMSNRLYVASLTAYLIGQFADIQLFGLLKRMTRGRFVWLRATGSTVVSQMLDSLLVTYILFTGVVQQDGSTMPVGAILVMAATGYVLKFLIALALTPLVYLGRWLIHTRLGLQPLPPEIGGLWV
jgi:uncharacterized integral membrane protein (TIGR00697 family)